jgi:hypothetical protein
MSRYIRYCCVLLVCVAIIVGGIMGVVILQNTSQNAIAYNNFDTSATCDAVIVK